MLHKLAGFSPLLLKPGLKVEVSSPSLLKKLIFIHDAVLCENAVDHCVLSNLSAIWSNTVQKP